MSINTQIDLGYYYACLSTKQHIRSKVEITSEYLPSLNPDTIQYQHNNLKAIIGESASQHSLELDKTRNEAYRILAYTLISKIIQPNTPNHINLVINYPLNIYNTKTKTEFEKFISTTDFINILVNNQRFIFHINKCITFPQTVPVAYVNPHFFQNSVKALIDIGGLTCQGIILDNFNPVPNTKFTENLGSIILYNQIRKSLNSRFSTNFQEYEIPNIINNGLSKFKPIISDIINFHILEIINHLKLNNWNIENLEIMFTGGGALLLKDYLLQHFPNSTFSNNPLWDNVLGLKVVSNNVFRQQT